MIGYQSYNIKSPLNGEAARWVEQNLHRLPLDPVILFVDTAKTMPPAPRMPPAPVSASSVATKTTSVAPPTAAAADAIVITCAGCKTQYRVSVQARGKWVRCKKCQNLIAVSAEAGS
jgi:predicted Zn finger-like uncharacterized protein